MTTIACDGKTMASDGLCVDHRDVVMDLERRKVFKLDDGRIIGAAGNSFDAASWRQWIESGKIGDCPVKSDSFAGLILNTDGSILWVDHKGREEISPAPCSVGSGEELAIGAMEAGLSPEEAVVICIRRDIHSGGTVFVEKLDAQAIAARSDETRSGSAEGESAVPQECARKSMP